MYKKYEELKLAACAVDFGDLVSLPVKLLESDAEAVSILRATYSHILVDEYQDVNRSSVRLLQRLTDSGKNLWAVGDARQAIYRFRGASSFNMSRFKTEDFPGGTGDRLRLNYRSTPEIVGAFSNFGGECMLAPAMRPSKQIDRPAVSRRSMSPSATTTTRRTHSQTKFCAILRTSPSATRLCSAPATTGSTAWVVNWSDAEFRFSISAISSNDPRSRICCPFCRCSSTGGPWIGA